MEFVLRIGAVILAAGGSSRLGRPKQLIQFRGKSLVRHIVDVAKEAGCAQRVVVLGSERERVEAELKETGVTILENKNWECGMGTSIRAGVKYLIDCGSNLESGCAARMRSAVCQRAHD
jgi:molybdenum cofactor cytidylyltransferase